MISKEEIKEMAELAKLRLSDEELDDYREKLSGVINYIGLLNEVNIENVEPTYGINEHIQHLREDVPKEGLTREEVLQNSIEDQYGYFKILRIVE